MMIVSLEVDPQKTFTPLCPEELPVPGGDEIVAELNAQAQLANKRAVSRDAHCRVAAWLCDEASQIMQPTGLPEADLTWVAHGIVGSRGYELLDGLPDLQGYDFCVWKGVDPALHPYGACYHDLSERLSTGLLEWLQNQGTRRILVGGLATDFCVQTTVLQLLRVPDWQVLVNRAACRGLAEASTAAAWEKMAAAGALLFEDSAALADYLTANPV